MTHHWLLGWRLEGIHNRFVIGRWSRRWGRRIGKHRSKWVIWIGSRWGSWQGGLDVHRKLIERIAHDGCNIQYVLALSWDANNSFTCEVQSDQLVSDATKAIEWQVMVLEAASENDTWMEQNDDCKISIHPKRVEFHTFVVPVDGCTLDIWL